MTIKTFVFNDFQENTHIIWNDSKQAAIVDPGCYYGDEKQKLKQFIQENDLEITQIWLTHAHIDHILGVSFCKDEYKAPLYLHLKDKPIFDAAAIMADAYKIQNYEHTTVDFWIDESKKMNLGGLEFEILFLPGHAPGHVGFYESSQKACFSGDVLFKGGVGRTDLPFGNTQELENSIKEKLFTLPEEVVIYSGHGSKTTIGAEKNRMIDFF